jgi:hypothetical protein
MVQVMSALDEKVAKFCAGYGFSPQQTRIFTAMIQGALSNRALMQELGLPRGLCKQLDRIAQKTMTRSRAELLYLFFFERRGR